MNALPPASAETDPALAETVLVLTRLAPDADAIARVLRLAGFAVLICADMETFSDQLPHCLTAIVTIEALPPASRLRVEEALRSQPPWSDVPLVLLIGRASLRGPQDTWVGLGNVTVLERPLRPSALRAAVDSAARARRRQWQVRDLLTYSEQLSVQLMRAMTETHHRVKNNLQLVAALIDMSMMEDTEQVPRGELARLGTHIQVLAAIHDILTHEAAKGKASDLSVQDVLEKLLPLMQQSINGRRLDFQIEDMRLPTRQCISLALILNELVTNALKHSAGDVHVRLRLAATEAILSVQDGGDGFPDGFNPLLAAHTGLDLVLNLTRHDLGGNIHFENTKGAGGCARVTFPLADTGR
jgi:two-component sensor histidine kinase